MLFDCCGIRIGDGSGDFRPNVTDPVGCGTGIERDGNAIVSTGEYDGDLKLFGYEFVGVIIDGELRLVSDSLVVEIVNSSCFFLVSFDLFFPLSSKTDYLNFLNRSISYHHHHHSFLFYEKNTQE